MHQFLSIYDFTLLLLHVLATVCHPQGARLYQLSYIAMSVLIKKYYIIYSQPHTTRNFINQKPKLACNSEGTDELPDDGTQLPIHVGAAK
jgi:hypothetical protein